MGQSVESALSALSAIFSALSAYFNNFQQKIPCRNKRESPSHCCSFWAVLDSLLLIMALRARLVLAVSSSHCLSLWLSLALTGSIPVSLWLSMALYGSLWLPLWLPLPLSGLLWPSLDHYCSLISLIQSLTSLLGSQRRCHADALYPGVCLCVLLQAKFLPETTRTLSQLCNMLATKWLLAERTSFLEAAYDYFQLER